MAKKKVAKPKIPRVANPKKKLESIRKEIRKVKQPVYSLNRKIKTAPSKYYERKYKKEKKIYLESIQGRISDLTAKRTDLANQYRKYEDNKRERSRIGRKVNSLEKKIQNAVDNKDIKTAEKLRYELLKQLGILDKLYKDMGVVIPGVDVTDEKTLDQEGGKGYVPDEYNPYAIWEAIKQLHFDLDSGEWKYIIVNGKRFSTNHPDEILAEASMFWIINKKQTGGTPYIMRYENEKMMSVKYLSYNS